MDTGQLGFHTGRPGKRRRLAIVSTFDELCGIASYTNHLLPQLEPFFDIEVLDLDQYLLKHTSRSVEKLAEDHIKDLVRRLKTFDCVNIQLEHGTLGRRTKDILRRFRMLAKAAPELSVTFHTVLSADPMPWATWWGYVLTGRFGAASNLFKSNRRSGELGAPIYQLLKKLGRSKPVHCIVHTRREMRLLKYVYRMENIHAHPLTYLNADQVECIRTSTDRSTFPGLANVPPDAKLIGTFGFLSPYKGFETAIKAMSYLPADHHMLVFGGIHPQTIRRGVSVDPYIAKLLDQAHIGRTMLDEVSELKASNINISLDIGSNAAVATEHPKDLSDRLHFMGVLSDDDFARAMSVCDVVAVPYLEVGQSGSGPISIALDMGCRVVASRTTTFLQLARFHPEALEFFDIGNFVELAQRIVSPPTHDPRQRALRYNTATNAAVYRVANGAETAGAEWDGVEPALPIV